MNPKMIAVAIIVAFLVLGGVTFLALYDSGEQTTYDDPVETEVVTQDEEPEPEPEPDLPPVRATETQDGTLTVLVVREGTTSPIKNCKVDVFTDLEGGSNRPVKRQVGNERRGGKFDIQLKPGSYVVQAQAAGFQRATQRFQIAEQQRVEVTLALSKGLTISGHVYDGTNRRAIEGAMVYGYKELGAPDDDMMERLLRLIDIEDMAREEPAVATTDAEGFYQLEGLDGVYYEVVAMAPGYSPQSRANILPSKTKVDFRLPEGSIFKGRIVDQSGNGITDAKVSVYPEVDTTDIIRVVAQKARPPVASAVTVGGGEFELSSLGIGMYNLHVTATGFQEGNFKKVRVHPGENTGQEYTLLPGLVLAGQVVDEDGEPIAGARVRPVRSGNPRSQTMFIKFEDESVECDEEGHFSFNSLSRGKYSLLAHHHDYAAKQLRDVNVGKTDLVIELDFGSAVSGTVTRNDNGEPILGAKLMVNGLLDVKKHAITDENGEYRITGISTSRRGTRYANVQAEGYARVSNQQIRVESGKEIENQDFELEATAIVTGIVLNSAGEPLPRARVMAKRTGKNASVPVTVGSAMTDDAGAFNISNLEAGNETWLEVIHSEYLNEESSTFDVAPGEKVEAGELVLSLGGSIAGQIVDAGNAPVSGAMVAIREEGETEFSLTKTASADNRGNFLLKGLSAGTVDLQIKSTRYLETIEENVIVNEGQVTSDVRIVLSAGSLLGGRILDVDGNEVTNAIVRVREVVGGLSEHRQETDVLGLFNFSSLASKDTVELEVSHPEFSPHFDENVAVGQEDLEITLQRLGGVRGTVVGESGEVVVAFSLQPQPVLDENASPFASSGSKPAAKTVQDAEGQFEYTGLATGTYSVVVRAPNFASFVYPDVQITAGDIVDLGEAILPSGGVVEGIVIDSETAQPVEGADVRVVTGGNTSTFTTTHIYTTIASSNR